MASKYSKCARCQYFVYEYENSFCPRQDRIMRDLALDDPKLMDKAIDNCTPEEIRQPKTYWTKKEILRVCEAGGATYATIQLMKTIPLEDLRAILLKYMGQEPRGRYNEIWKVPPNQWQEVRRTAMYGIRWGQIDEWNRNTRRICANCRYLQFDGVGELEDIYCCILNRPWAMYECETKIDYKSCNRWKSKYVIPSMEN